MRPHAKQIALTVDEMYWGADIGVQRRLESRRDGRKNKYDMPHLGWSQDIEGALSELALCKLKGWSWSASVNSFKEKADIGDHIEVRWTDQIEEGKLIVRPDDVFDRLFVLVIGLAPAYRVWGFLQGHAARRREWWWAPNGRPPAWFVPREYLISIDHLTLDPPHVCLGRAA